MPSCCCGCFAFVAVSFATCCCPQRSLHNRFRSCGPTLRGPRAAFRRSSFSNPVFDDSMYRKWHSISCSSSAVVLR